MRYFLVAAVFLSGIQPCLADNRLSTLNILSAELERSQSQLRMPDFKAPYFMAFRLVEHRSIDIEGAFGAIVENETDYIRRAAVDVRVGDYTFDSSPETDDIDLGPIGEFTPSKDAPLDDQTPLALRAVYWGLADQAYKDALSTYLRKKARAVSKLKRVQVDSFSRQSPSTYLGNVLSIEADQTVWLNRARKLSKRFRAMPSLLVGTVGLTADHTRTYLVDTEGTRVVEERVIYSIHIHATTRAPDGLLLEQGQTLYGRTMDDLPDEVELTRRVDKVMADLKALRKAPVIDPYTGPAILEPEAAGVFFHETIGHRLEGERQNDEEEGQTFRGQIGKQILPSFISLRDDPTIQRLGGQSLNGHYRHDDQGVAAQNVRLIKEGVLKTFLTSRTPNESVSQSNGHGRAQGTRRPVARMGNLVVEGHAAVPRARLMAMLIEEARRQKKPYGLIIADITGGQRTPAIMGIRPSRVPRAWFIESTQRPVQKL